MTNIEILLANNLGTVIIVWAIVYALDYYLTIIGARIYAAGVNQHLIFEESYEITPEFQEDVNALQLVSTRLLTYIIGSSGVILVVWLLAVRLLGYEEVFAVLIGGLFLREAAIYLRHIRNIALFLNAVGEMGVRGQIRYPRWLSLRTSGIELLGFALFYLILFLLDRSWFFFGGMVACIATAIHHLSVANEAFARKTSLESQKESQNPDYISDLQ